MRSNVNARATRRAAPEPPRISAGSRQTNPSGQGLS